VSDVDETTEQKHENEWVTFNMKLRPSMTRSLDVEAEELGISRAALIRVILDRHLKSEV
jgi:hypothetical protein